MDNQSVTIEIREDKDGKYTIVLVEWHVTVSFEDTISDSKDSMRVFATDTARAYMEYWKGIVDFKIQYIPFQSEALEHG